jgi:PAS domain S-box-containing protein
MAHHFPDGTISVIDEDWQYIFIDGQALSTLGFTAQSLLHMDIRTRVSPEYLEVMKPVVLSAFQGEPGQFEIFTHGRYFVCYVVPLPDIKGQVRRVMIVSQDISRRRVAEEETRKALEKERQLGELKSRFVSMASHEFRTPLATILSSVALIARYENEEDADKRLKHIQRIQSSVRHLTATLNDFLSLSKIEEGVTVNNPAEADIVELCEDVREEMQITAKEGQQIEYRHEGDETCITLDRQLLHNILVNLLSNAMKYSPENSIIRLESRIEDKELSIQVKDNGMGIPREDQQHIFSTFFRAHNAGNIQGTGMGLHIVRRYTELMGGAIGFVSEQNKGTTFSLNLPNVPVPEKG